MGRRLTGRLVLATHNAGKLAEMRELMEPFGVDVTSAGELGLPVPDETGSTFVENARIKALAAVSATGLPALADDSGLCVDALAGAPGIHTADWGGPDRNWRLAMDRVQRELQSMGAIAPSERGASFMATLCLAWPDGHEEIFVGEARGTLVWPPRGERGHGYDPMFQPDGFRITFGEMTSEQKHGVGGRQGGLSHRARSFQAMAAACLKDETGA